MVVIVNHISIAFNDVMLFVVKNLLHELGIQDMNCPYPAINSRPTAKTIWIGIHHLRNLKRPAETSVLVWNV